jgi:hypothetical protein
MTGKVALSLSLILPLLAPSPLNGTSTMTDSFSIRQQQALLHPGQEPVRPMAGEGLLRDGLFLPRSVLEPAV